MLMRHETLTLQTQPVPKRSLHAPPSSSSGWHPETRPSVAKKWGKWLSATLNASADDGLGQEVEASQLGSFDAHSASILNSFVIFIDQLD